jgi:pimeloyl-ACP methyl ester carboxylesterase
MAPTLATAMTSRTADLDGPVHYLDWGGPEGAPVVVGVHGLGGASWNWAAIAPLLTDTVRFVAPDLAGHGETPALDRGTTVKANRRLLDRFIREVVGEPVILMGNSMGGALSVLEAAKSPEMVRGAVLIDPALPRPLLSGKIDPRTAAQFALMILPGLGEAALTRRRKRLTPEQQVRETLAFCSVDSTRIPDDVVQLGVQLAQTRAGDRYASRDFLYAARSLVKLLTRSKLMQRAMDRIEAPVLLIHGEQDRLVSASVARAAAKAHPAWQVEILDGVGHVPMLEVPLQTAELVRDWL